MSPTTTAAARAVAAYADHAVSTASPVRLVVMLYERLVRDLRLGAAALRNGDLAAANGLLQHAQEIVTELRSSLDTSAWEAGSDLGAVYDFLYDELVAANVSKDPFRVETAYQIVEPLLEAWQEAAVTMTSGIGVSGQ